jgi:hypothetical protein
MKMRIILLAITIVFTLYFVIRTINLYATGPELDYDEDVYDACIQHYKENGIMINQSSPTEDLCHNKLK